MITDEDLKSWNNNVDTLEAFFEETHKVEYDDHEGVMIFEDKDKSTPLTEVSLNSEELVAASNIENILIYGAYMSGALPKPEQERELTLNIEGSTKDALLVPNHHKYKPHYTSHVNPKERGVMEDRREKCAFILDTIERNLKNKLNSKPDQTLFEIPARVLIGIDMAMKGFATSKFSEFDGGTSYMDSNQQKVSLVWKDNEVWFRRKVTTESKFDQAYLKENLIEPLKKLENTLNEPYSPRNVRVYDETVISMESFKKALEQARQSYKDSEEFKRRLNNVKKEVPKSPLAPAM